MRLEVVETLAVWRDDARDEEFFVWALREVDDETGWVSELARGTEAEMRALLEERQRAV